MRVFIFFAIAYSLSAFSHECQNTLKTIFQDQFPNKRPLSDDRCAQNIYNLLKASNNSENYEVLFLVRETRLFRPVPIEMPIKGGQIPLLPSISWDSKNQFWNYHVVLISQGNIYDPHHSTSPTKAEQYFETMFPQSEIDPHLFFPMDRLSHLYLQKISGSQYVKEYETLGEESLTRKYRNKKNSELERARNLLK